MPQRQFWTEQHATSITWHYAADLSRPEAPSLLTLDVRDQAGLMMEHKVAKVPLAVTHEQVGTSLQETWESYLFGERHAAARSLEEVATRYRRWLAHGARRCV